MNRLRSVARRFRRNRDRTPTLKGEICERVIIGGAPFLVVQIDRRPFHLGGTTVTLMSEARFLVNQSVV